MKVQKNLADTLNGVDAVVLAVRHSAYLELDPDSILEMTDRPVAIIDCFGILTDEEIRTYFTLGCEVKALGRGHIQRIKERVRAERLRAIS